MTDQEYVRQIGNICPFCRSTEGLEPEGRVDTPDGNITNQTFSCTVCGSIWDDIYELRGYKTINNATQE